jgi:hypothetical protein
MICSQLYCYGARPSEYGVQESDGTFFNAVGAQILKNKTTRLVDASYDNRKNITKLPFGRRARKKSSAILRPHGPNSHGQR